MPARRAQRRGLLSRFFEPFIAEGADTMHAHRARVVVICYVVVLLMTLRGGFFHAISGSLALAAGYGAFALLSAALLLKFRHDKNLNAAAQAAMAMTVSSTFMATAMTGGLRGTNITPWLALIVGAVLILGRRGLIWVVVSILIPLFFEMAEIVGVDFPDAVPPEMHGQDDFVTWLSMALVLAVFTVAWEAARERAVTRSFEAARVKSRFLANISHELRTPLQILSSTLDLMDQDEPSRPRQVLIDRAHQHAEVLSQLVDDLLDLSTTQGGEIDLRPKDFELPALCQELIGACRPLAESRGLELRLQVDDWLHWVHGDPRRLRQALANLLDNAIKFTQEGHVELQVHQAEADHVLFSVQDTGIGLPKTERQHIFTDFYQVDDSLTRQAQGAGLGLFLAQRIVEHMGGRIEVESEEGRGSRFWFTVPMPACNTPRMAPLRRSESPALRILLVEDNEDAREMVAELLGALGHEVQPAVNGQEALEQWREQSPDLILMDVQMPTMDGCTASRLIRAEEAEQGRPSVPIVAMTGHCTQKDRDACRASGMGDFLQKPFRLQQLREILDRV